MCDFGIEDHGTIFLLRPLTLAAINWVDENLPEDRHQFGSAIVVERRFVGSIVEGIQRDGLRIDVPIDDENRPGRDVTEASFENVVKELRRSAPGRVTTVSYSDMLFLYQIGALDWEYAGTLCFQRVIKERGTLDEKRRLRDLKVGFSFDEIEGRG